MSKVREFRYGATSIKYIIYSKNIDQPPFCVSDVLGELQDINDACYITDIYTEFSCRNQGHAKAAINKLIELVATKMPIIVCATVSMLDYPLEPSDDIFDSEIEWKSKFLEKLGFTNINEYVRYEFQEAYLYVNELTQTFIDNCITKLNNLDVTPV